jgi:hypothetical protein
MAVKTYRYRFWGYYIYIYIYIYILNPYPIYFLLSLYTVFFLDKHACMVGSMQYMAICRERN